jgi:hypothetical protein
MSSPHLHDDYETSAGAEPCSAASSGRQRDRHSFGCEQIRKAFLDRTLRTTRVAARASTQTWAGSHEFPFLAPVDEQASRTPESPAH